MFALTSHIHVLQHSMIHFLNNRATNGGAMALLGFSILEILPGSELHFDSNQLGGAIYYAILHLIKLSLFFLTSVLSLRRHKLF